MGLRAALFDYHQAVLGISGDDSRAARPAFEGGLVGGQIEALEAACGAMAGAAAGFEEGLDGSGIRESPRSRGRHGGGRGR